MTGRHSSEQLDPELREDTRLVDLAVAAIGLLHTEGPYREVSLMDFVSAVQQLAGVRSVTVQPDPDAADNDVGPQVPASRTEGGVIRRTVVLPLTLAGESVTLLVELASARDPGWAGDRQFRRLSAVLALLAMAAPRMPGAPTAGTAEQPDVASLGVLLRDTRCLVFRVDSAGEWTSLSEPGEVALGSFRRTPVPNGSFRLVHPDDRAAADQAVRLATERGRRGTTTDVRMRDGCGSWRTLEIVLHDLRSVPTIGSIIGYGLDVTELRSARQRHEVDQARLNAVVTRLQAAAFVVDGEGRIVAANDAFARVFGGGGGQSWLGTHRRQATAAVLARCREPGAAEAEIAAAITSHEVRANVRLDLENGRTLAVDLVPLRHDRQDLGALWYFHDVEHPDPATAPDHELWLRSQQFLTALELSEQFVSTVADELQKPLLAARKFAELLVNADRESLNARQRLVVRSVQRNIELSRGLISDLVLLTTLNRCHARIELASVRLPKLVRKAVAEVEPEASYQEITVALDASPGPDVLGDRKLLGRVLRELLDNAVKFNRIDGFVRVCVKFDDPHWLVEVADTGIGIPAEELHTVTGPFVRGSNAVTGLAPGSGLGLAICRRVVEHHGGTVELSSVLGEGTTVMVRLPYRHDFKGNSA